MDLKEVIRRAILRSLRKGANRHRESLRITLPAVEIIADTLADELAQIIDMFRQEGDA